MATERVGIDISVKAQGVAVIDQTGKKLQTLSNTAKATSVQQAALGKAMAGTTEKSLRLSGGILRANVAMMALSGVASPAATQVAAVSSAFAEMIPNLSALTGSLSTVKVALATTAAGFAAVLAAVAAAGAAIGVMAVKWGELKEVQAEAADAEARSLEMTERQKEQYKLLAEALGSTVTELSAQGITLQEIIKRARSGEAVWDDYRIALEEVTGETVAHNEAMRRQAEELANMKTGAEQVADILRKQAEAAKAAGAALIEQAGIITWDEYAAQVEGAEAALRQLEERGYTAEQSAELLGNEIKRLVELGDKLGHSVPPAFRDIVESSQQAVTVAQEFASVQWEIARASQNALTISEQGALRAAEKMAMLSEWAGRYRKELQGIANAVSSVTIGGGVTREFDKDDPRVRRIIDRIEGVAVDGFGKFRTAAKSVLAQIQEGDVLGLREIAKALRQDFEFFRDTPRSGPAAGAAAGLLQLVQEVLGTLPGRAMGGPVMAGHPYVVGEGGGGRGELFVPDVDGAIVPDMSKGLGMWMEKVFQLSPRDRQMPGQLAFETNRTLIEHLREVVRELRKGRNVTLGREAVLAISEATAKHASRNAIRVRS